MPFKKCAQICELKTRHGVDLGTTYKNEVACKRFVHFVAKAKRKQLADTRAKADFLWMDLQMRVAVTMSLCWLSGEIVMERTREFTLD